MLVHDLGLSRRACDRCHGQKLRCKREGNDANCLRCQRANVQCVPRPVRSQRLAQSNASQRMPAPGNEHKGDPRAESRIVERGDQEPAQPSNPSPLPLPDTTSDLDLGLDFSSLKNDLTHAHEDAFDAQIVSRFGSPDPSFTQVADNLAPVEFNMLPYFPEATPLAAQPQGRRMSRDSTLRGSNPPSGGKSNLNAADFDREGRGTNRTPDRQATRSVFDGRPTSTSRSYSKGSDMNSSQRAFPQMTRLNIELLTSWMRRLSELNVELHQHMLSIPPTASEHCGWKNEDMRRAPQNTEAMPQSQRLHVDRTLQLSQLYTEILIDAFPSPRSRQGSGFHEPALTLDPALQLLVLSCFMCLIDSYDKILQHIREWIQVRLKTGSCIPNGCCLLPELAIGAHHLPESSSARPLVLVCLIETAVMQTHGAVSDLIKSAGDYVSSTRGYTVAPTGIEFSAGGATGGVAEVSLQAITAREEATLEFIQDVWKLAICCGET